LRFIDPKDPFFFELEVAEENIEWDPVSRRKIVVSNHFTDARYSLVASVPNAKNTNTKRLLMGTEDQPIYSQPSTSRGIMAKGYVLTIQKSACTSPQLVQGRSPFL
jgi:hypothetical protein